MIIKERSKPYELLVLELLDNRMTLPYEWRKKLAKRRRGYKGELELDPHTVDLGESILVANDLRLPTIDNSNHFQMDALLIAPDKLSIYEVKNHYGSYYVENGLFYTSSAYEVVDPSFQIGKAATLLRQHLYALGMHFKVETHLVFIDPTFMLHQAPRDFPFLLKGHLESHFQSIRQQQQPCRPEQNTLAKYVTEKHLFRVKNEDVPEFDYQDLRKGITCAACGSLHVKTQDYSCVCRSCGYREKTTLAIRRSIEEYRLLFPERKLTASEIQKWCLLPSHRQVHRVLEKHYTLMGNTRGAYYV